MQVTVSRVSPVEVSLLVSLPKEKVSSALDKAYGELSRTARIKGFRPGKVPRGVLKQYFGVRVVSDVLQKLVDETLPTAMQENRLEAVALPKVEPSGDLFKTDDWSYVALVEVRPEMESIDCGALALSRKSYPVSDEDVAKVIERRRDEHATLRTPEPARPARATDTVTFDLDVVVDGETKSEFAARGRTAEVGRGTLLPEIEAALDGASVGETKDVTVTFPETHRQADLAGKTATLKVTVTAIQEKVLPELDDEFAKDLGHIDLASFQQEVRAELERAAKERAEDELKNDAIEALVKANPVAAPPSLTTQVMDQVRRELRLSSGGAPVDEEKVRSEAEDRVRAGLLLTELARKNNLLVTDADLNAKLEEMSKETGRAVQRLRAEYREGQKRDLLVSSVLEDKVLAFVLSKATITDAPAEAAQGA